MDMVASDHLALEQGGECESRGDDHAVSVNATYATYLSS